MSTLGILHPGNMGISLAVQAIAGGHDVLWCSHGRSEATRKRAEAAGLQETASLQEASSASEILISVCPPAAAEDLARAVLATGFDGLYVEANAISPHSTERIGGMVLDAGANYVDGGIVGPPAIGDRRNYLYLSGPKAGAVARLFTGSQVTPKVLGKDYRKASAMKMCFASHTKGGWALTLNTLAAARAYDVTDHLLESWKSLGNELTDQQRQRLELTAKKAWRFEGEMNEIADTFADVGLPDGIHLAAAEIYQRLDKFKDQEDINLDAVIRALLRTEDDSDVS